MKRSLAEDLEKFDLETATRNSFPILFELLGENKIDWKQINKTASDRLKKYEERHNRIEREFEIQGSFFHLLMQSWKGEVSNQRFLDYINKLFEELADQLDDTEKKKIANTIFNMLVNFDQNYLNFVGELSVLNLYKKRLGYKLVNTEAPIDEKKHKGISVDFSFLDETTGSYYHLEIVNLHLNNKKVISPETIETLLMQKIGEKLSSKKIDQLANTFLVPILWGQYDEIVPIYAYYLATNIVFPKTIQPCCFMTFTDQYGNSVHKFGTIDTILKDVKPGG